MICSNIDELEAWLTSFATCEETRCLMLVALRGSILKDARLFEPARILREPLSRTVAEALDRGDPVHRFWPARAVTLVGSDVAHVADWLGASVADGAAWLSRTDDEGRPLKLRKIGSLAQAVREADKAMARANQRLSSVVDTASDGETDEFLLEDGWRIVRLRTPGALDRESVRMHHCIGNGNYDRAVAGPLHRFLSVRRPDGRPVATIELSGFLLGGLGFERPAPGGRLSRFLGPDAVVPSLRSWSIVQIKGPRNADPEADVVLRIRPWLEARGIALDGRTASSAGLLRLPDGRLVRLEDLEPGADLGSGDLRIDHTGVRTPDGHALLPSDVRLRGNLEVVFNGRAALSENTHVEGNIVVTFAKLAIPASTRIGGILDLSLSFGTADDFGFAPDRPFPTVGRLVFCRTEQIPFVPPGYVRREVMGVRVRNQLTDLADGTGHRIALVAEGHVEAFDRRNEDGFLGRHLWRLASYPERGSEDRVLMNYVFAMAKSVED